MCMWYIDIYAGKHSYTENKYIFKKPVVTNGWEKPVKTVHCSQSCANVVSILGSYTHPSFRDGVK